MKSIVLIGSSIFANWTHATKMLPNYSVVNRAISGTITADWIEYLPGILTAVTPDAILYYCGSNDLNENIPKESILANMSACRRIIDRISPATKLAYFGIIKAPQKADKWELIDSLNQDISSSLLTGDIYIESNGIFFQNGAVVPRLFLDDMLHLTDEAYVHLSNYTAPIIDRWLADICDCRED